VSHRRPSDAEWRLLNLLVSRAPQLGLRSGWEAEVRVQPMADGEMGSLRITLLDEPPANRHFGRRVAECQFKDQDGVAVLASLNVDQEGTLFELDIWKTNFERLIQIPENLSR
jgi:hypothetical protein